MFKKKEPILYIVVPCYNEEEVLEETTKQLKEKLALLEETFDVDEGTLAPDMSLDEIEEYDSMTKLSLIVMVEEEFGKKLSGEDIKGFQTVQDILNVMQ